MHSTSFSFALWSRHTGLAGEVSGAREARCRVVTGEPSNDPSSTPVVPVAAMSRRARQYFTGFQPSSPAVALLRDGQLLYMMERRDIESRSADMIAAQLTLAFDKHCAPVVK